MRGGKIGHRIAAFGRQASGAVAMLFALALIPLMIFIGAAIDFGVALRDANLLAVAADAAALSTITPKSPAFQKAVAQSHDGVIAVDTTPYVALFQANVGGQHQELTLQTPTVTIEKKNGYVTATVTFSATVKTAIMGIFGKSTIPIKKTSTASTNLPAYTDFYLLLDNSPSMGIGATAADIANLITLTSAIPNNPNEPACGFACHDLSQAANTDYYTIARNNNVTLRIDLLRAATKSLMTTAQNSQILTNQFQFAVYTFGTSSDIAQGAALTNVAPLSSNLSNVATLANAVDLMTVNGQGQYNDQDTNFDGAMPAINNAIPNPGDGKTQSQAQKVLFLVTDGVSDESLNGVRTIQPINTALCTAIKNRGIKIAVLYTTYYPLPTNAFYVDNVKPMIDNGAVPLALQNCASAPADKYYAAVATGGDVGAALSQLFSNVISVSRLTK